MISRRSRIRKPPVVGGGRLCRARRVLTWRRCFKHSDLSFTDLVCHAVGSPALYLPWSGITGTWKQQHSLSVLAPHRVSGFSVLLPFGLREFLGQLHLPGY